MTSCAPAPPQVRPAIAKAKQLTIKRRTCPAFAGPGAAPEMASSARRRPSEPNKLSLDVTPGCARHVKKWRMRLAGNLRFRSLLTPEIVRRVARDSRSTTRPPASIDLRQRRVRLSPGSDQMADIAGRLKRTTVGNRPGSFDDFFAAPRSRVSRGESFSLARRRPEARVNNHRRFRLVGQVCL